MVFTSKISKRGRGRGRGRGREEVEVKNRKMGSCSTFTPRRNSPRLKTQRALNYMEVEESCSLSASARLPPSSQLPFQGHEGSKANSPNRVEASLDGDSVELEFLHEFYDKVMSAHEVPIRRALDRNIGSLGASMGNSQSHEGSTPSSPNRVVASLDDGDSDEVLHVEEVDATSDHKVPIKGALDTMERVEEASKDEQGQGGRAHSSLASPLTTSHHSVTKSINITEMVMDDDVSDIDSVLRSEADVACVEGYKVKPKNAEMLRAILAKHGDIGANCTLKSVVLRSFSMEVICEIVLELEKSHILHVAKDKIKGMQTSICDLERQNIEVGWLKARLDMILAAKNVIPILKQSSGVRMLKNQRKEKVKLLREQLNNYSRNIQSLQLKVNATIGELSRAESEAKETDMIISESSAKLKLVIELDTLISGLI